MSAQLLQNDKNKIPLVLISCFINSTIKHGHYSQGNTSYSECDDTTPLVAMVIHSWIRFNTVCENAKFAVYVLGFFVADQQNINKVWIIYFIMILKIKLAVWLKTNMSKLLSRYRLKCLFLNHSCLQTYHKIIIYDSWNFIKIKMRKFVRPEG